MTTDFGGTDQIASAAFQSDGKIVVVGNASINGFGGFGIVRYNSDGTLDTTFGTGGRVITSFFDIDPNLTRRQGSFALVIQQDGKIVAAGAVLANLTVTGDYYTKYDFALARYNADGSLDTTFGSGGKVITDVVANQSDAAWALALQPDGKIVAAGITGNQTITTTFALVRYNPNGSLDATFGTGGKVVTNIANSTNSDSAALSVLIQPDGKIVAGGSVFTLSVSYSTIDFALARYDSTGTLDSGFGTGGVVVTDFGSANGDPRDDFIRSMALQPDGKIIAAGTGEPNRNATSSDFVIARYNPNGSLDSSFGTGGKVATDFYGTIDMGNSIALQPDGKFVVAGIANGIIQGSVNPQIAGTVNGVYQINSPTSSEFAVARYNPDGSLDSSFGTGGRGTTDFYASVDAATKVLIRPDGNVIVAGFAQTTPFLPLQSHDLSKTDLALALYFGNYLSPTKLNDFDGDGRSDVSVWRESSGVWFWLNSSNEAFGATQFGSPGDRLVPGDYDGDGKTDFAVWRPSNGTWYIQRSRDGFTAMQFGLSTDLPVQADFDGDGKTDIAVFRPLTGTWYLQQSTAGFAAVQFGQNGDRPVPGDYDGDGKRDIAVYRPSTGVWYQLRSGLGFTAQQFGITTDKVIPGDFDGDGLTDLAVYRDGVPGVWYIQQSTAGFTAAQFGTTGDIPTAGDFDSDGKADLSVWRPSTGTWYSQRSTTGFSVTQFGTNGDKPVPSAYVPVQ